MKDPEGLISRVAFYALDLALEKVPVKAGRLRDFLDVVLVYDARPAANYSWSFGSGLYWGVRGTCQDWGSFC